jgi:tetratricopeptide (TPR) repeat protein
MNTPNFNPSERLRQGHALQQQGKLAEAGAIYREVLDKDPRNAPALHLMGVVVMQSGQIEPGLELIRQSLAILPGFAPAHDNLGKGLERLGRHEEALTAFGRVIALAPGHAEGHGSRGRVLERLGRFEEALKDFDKALSLKGDPDYALNRGAVLLQMGRHEEALTAFDKAIAMGLTHPLGRFNRGVVLMALQRPEDALAAFDDAIARQPDYADAYVNRGLVLEVLSRKEDALASFEQAIAINPDMQEAYLNRGALLDQLGRHKEAIAAYDALLARWPGDAIAYNNRGSVQKTLGALEKALADFDRAVTLAPDNANFHDNRGNTLQALGRLDQAQAAYDTALEVDPNARRPAFSKATLLLLQGRFAQGWPLYEMRPRQFALAALEGDKSWNDPGADIKDKTVLLYDEQGIGDAIQFARFVEQVEARGAKALLMVRPSLVALFKGLTANVPVLALHDAPPDHDLHAALNSLPFLLASDDALGMAAPYMAADAARVTAWKKKIGDKDFRVGIAWQGKTDGNADASRSFPLAALAPLAKLPGVRLISLQKGEGEEQLASLLAGMTVETLGAGFDAGPDALLDTAAAMQALDLVITCDTSLAHLAGALGRPCWVALKQVPEWRWQLARADSPWYPGMKLFRQPGRGDWDGVFAAMAQELAQRKD